MKSQKQMFAKATSTTRTAWEAFLEMQETENPLSCSELNDLAVNPKASPLWRVIRDAALDYNREKGIK